MPSPKPIAKCEKLVVRATQEIYLDLSLVCRTMVGPAHRMWSLSMLYPYVPQ